MIMNFAEGSFPAQALRQGWLKNKLQQTGKSMSSLWRGRRGGETGEGTESWFHLIVYCFHCASSRVAGGSGGPAPPPALKCN